MTIQLHVPSKTEIELYSGDYFDFDNPRAENIHIEDIAHGLSNICRFTGHVKRYYSVAEHAVHAAQYAQWNRWPIEHQLACFHHDDAETYLGDIVRPFKHLLGDTLRDIEAKIDQAICDALGLPFGPEEFHSDYVKEADNWCLMMEARELIPSGGKMWGGGSNNWEEGIESIEGPMLPELGMAPQAAEQFYMQVYERYHANGIK